MLMHGLTYFTCTPQPCTTSPHFHLENTFLSERGVQEANIGAKQVQEENKFGICTDCGKYNDYTAVYMEGTVRRYVAEHGPVLFSNTVICNVISLHNN